MKAFVGVLFAVLLCLEGTLFAGGSTGGGNVVLCTDPTTGVTTYRLLDYMEAEIMMPELTPVLGQGKTELEKVENVLRRLENFDKNRADSYRKTAADFFANTHFLTKGTLPDIKDHDYVTIDRVNCRIEQLAVQNLSPFPEVKKYIIRKDFWDKLSIDDKAGLILHELIYEEALAAGHKTSKNTRYFNALISSKKIEAWDLATYEDRLEIVGLDGSFVPGAPGPTMIAIEEIPDVTVEAEKNLVLALSSYIFSSGSNPIAFAKLSGPSWISVASNGTMAGTPTLRDVGTHDVFVEARDSGGFALRTSVHVTVVPNQVLPGPIEVADECVLVATPAQVAVGQTVELKVIVGSPLESARINGITVDPKHPILRIVAQRGGAHVTASATVGLLGPIGPGGDRRVVYTTCVTNYEVMTGPIPIAPNSPPVATNGIRFVAEAGEPVSFSLFPYVKDPDGEALTFKKIKGRDWAEVSADGVLEGTPELDSDGPDEEKHLFWVEAEDPRGLKDGFFVEVLVRP